MSVDMTPPKPDESEEESDAESEFAMPGSFDWSGSSRSRQHRRKIMDAEEVSTPATSPPQSPPGEGITA
ncbi:hypothetical protein FRC11_010488, partial [Ceratobasidium sp. 423]